MIIKKINAEKTFQIRHPILRKGLPLDSCKFENDDDDPKDEITLLLID